MIEERIARLEEAMTIVRKYIEQQTEVDNEVANMLDNLDAQINGLTIRFEKEIEMNNFMVVVNMMGGIEIVSIDNEFRFGGESTIRFVGTEEDCQKFADSMQDESCQ
jgi:hypothetical protein